MPIVLNDGSVPFGTATILIGSDTYYIEDSSATIPTNVVDVPDEVGSPRKQVIVSGKRSGTMTLQVETTSSAIPSPGDAFNMPAYFSGDATSKSCSITEVSTPRSNNDYAKISVGWVEILK